MKDEKILVTGSSGFIGSSLISLLRASNISTRGLDKYGVDEEKLNLSDKISVEKVLNEYNPSIIVHAGTNSAGAYNKDFLRSYVEDSESLTNILSYLPVNPNVQLIFFSSSYVYSGLMPNKKYDENSLLNPKHNFGIAKFFFERLIQKTHKNNLIFRLTNVYGPGNHVNRTTIQDWVESGLNGGKIVIWGKGERKLQYIYISDVIALLLKCKTIGSGVYNIGGDVHNRVNQIANFISNNLNVEVINKIDKKEGETLPFLEIKKLKNKLPDFKFRDVKEGISLYIDSMR